MSVKNPLDALATLRTQKGLIDLVVTDLHMPYMNGFELQQQIDREFKLPVISEYSHIYISTHIIYAHKHIYIHISTHFCIVLNMQSKRRTHLCPLPKLILLDIYLYLL